MAHPNITPFVLRLHRAAFFSLLSLLSLLPLSLLGQGLPHGLFSEIDPAKMDSWVDSQMKGMTLEEEVGQLVMPIIYPSTKAADIEAARNLVTQHAIGGVLYQKGTLAEQYAMNQKLQAAAKVPLLISLDGEFGLWMRLKDAPRYPRAMALGHIRDKRYIYEYAREVARQCRLMGIHINFAPVADVNNDPLNPVIDTRSFGSTAEEVSPNVLAYGLGLEAGGVLSVSKHFPGHGNTSVDSHKAMPVIRASREELDRVELSPFRHYMEEGLGGMMIGHLAVPALDPESVPASLSRPIITDLLRKEMGFTGLIFTDAMEMQGIQSKDGLPISVRAVKAGVDILLGPINPREAIREVVAAVRAGHLSRDEIRAHCRRILQYKYRLIVMQPEEKGISPTTVAKAIKTPETLSFVDDLWYRSIEVKQGEERLPLSPKETAVVHLGISAANSFSKALTVGGITKQAFYKRVSADAAASFKGYQTVVVAIYERNPAAYDAFVKRLSSDHRVVLVFFTTPFASLKLPAATNKASVWINAFENTAQSHQAVAKRLLERGAAQRSVLLTHASEAERRLTMSSFFQFADAPSLKTPPKQIEQASVSKAKYYQEHSKTGVVGEDKVKALSMKVREIGAEGLRADAYPGCRVVASYRGQIVLDESIGSIDGSSKNPVTHETVYDLASVTKAVATTPAVIMLVGEGKLALSDEVGKHLPRFRGTAIEKITVRELLWHRSGLTPTINFYTSLIDSTSLSLPLISYKPQTGFVNAARNVWFNPQFKFREDLVSEMPSADYPMQMAQDLYLSPKAQTIVFDRIAQELPRSGRKYRYSDVNFVLLAAIVEAISGEPLDSYIEHRLYEPLASGLTFRPLEKGRPLERIAPSQYDHFLRKQEVRGTVDDETAAVLGGVAGNAGVFGTAYDLLTLAELLRKGGGDLLPKKTLRQFTTNADAAGIRYLGFDKSGRNGNTANSASASTYGHTGFTGTCLWIDPVHEISFVFLSNRTYPSRLQNKLMTLDIRPRMQQAIYDVLALNK